MCPGMSSGRREQGACHVFSPELCQFEPDKREDFVCRVADPCHELRSLLHVVLCVRSFLYSLKRRDRERESNVEVFYVRILLPL